MRRGDLVYLDCGDGCGEVAYRVLSALGELLHRKVLMALRRVADGQRFLLNQDGTLVAVSG